MIGLLSFSSFSLINDNIFASLEKKLVLGRVGLKKFALQDPLYSPDLVLNIDTHYIAFFFFIIALAIFLLSIKPWARAFFLCIMFIALIFSSQIIFLIFDINIYIIKLILSSFFVFFFTTLFDADLNEVNWLRAFKYSPKNKIKALEHKKKHELVINKDLSNSERGLLERDLRAKYFLKVEDKYESLLIDFQEKILAELSDIQGKLNSNTDQMSLNSFKNLLFMARTDFNNSLDKLDTWLFNLAPLNFEAERAFLDSLNLLVEKSNAISHDQTKIKLETKIRSVKMDYENKINIFRSINELIFLIDEVNHDIDERPLKILLLIELSEEDYSLKISLNYPNRMIDTDYHSYRLKEVKNRLEVIGANLEFIENEKLSKSQKINSIIISIAKENFTLAY